MTKKELEQANRTLEDRLDMYESDMDRFNRFKCMVAYVVSGSHTVNDLQYLEGALKKMKLCATKWKMLKGHIDDLERNLDD